MSSGGKKPRRHSFRIFPTEAKSTRGSFAQYIEESGTSFLLKTAIVELFDLPNKPENPIEWFRLYFKQLASAKTDENEVKEDHDALKMLILKQESTLVHLRLEQHRLEVKLDELYFEAKHVHTIPPKPTYDEDFRRYRDVLDDPRWRIRPDPDVVVTRKDILMQALETEGKSKSRINIQSSTNFQQQEQDAWATSSLLSMDAIADREDYKDYPKLYFGIEDEPEIPVSVPTLEEGEDLDEAGQEQINALLEGMDGENAGEGEEEMMREDEFSEDEHEEEDENEHFGALKSGRSGKRSEVAGKVVKKFIASQSSLTTNLSRNNFKRKKSKKDKGDKIDDKTDDTSLPPSPTRSKSKRKGGKKGKEDNRDDGEKSEKGSKKKKGKKSKSQKSKVAIDDGGGGDVLLSKSTDAQTIPSDPSLLPVTESEISTKSGKKGRTKKSKKGKRHKKAELVEEDEEGGETMPIDPLTLELPPVTPAFWKEDFSLTKGHENMFDFDDADEFGYEDVLLEDLGVYLNSRGEKRTRQFQSQIIHDAFFKPDRGQSIELDYLFEPPESENPSMTVVPTDAGVDNAEVKSNPSVVTATISDGTIEARMSRDKSHTKIDEFRSMIARGRDRKKS